MNVVPRLAWMHGVLGMEEALFLHKRALIVVVPISKTVRCALGFFIRG